MPKLTLVTPLFFKRMFPVLPWLFALPLLAHEATRHAFERSLDPGEAAILASIPSLARTASATASRPCQLTLSITDAVTGRVVPALVRIKTAAGNALEFPGLISRGVKLRENHPARFWYVLTKPVALALPQEVLTVEAISGLETDLARTEVDLRGKVATSLALALHRFAQPSLTGWHTGNTHLHLRGMTRQQAKDYLLAVPRADGLEFVFVSYLERQNESQDYITNTFSPADLESLSQPGLRFGNGEEHRHNLSDYGEGYGHVLFLDLPALVRPVSIGAGIMNAGPDYPPLRPGIDQARKTGATIIWCHNGSGMENGPSWLSGRLDAQNIFDGGSRGGYADTFYRLLNIGLKIPFSTGTDWFIYDFSRVYARVAAPPTIETWLKALAAGRTFITNGPLLEFSIEKFQIGDTIKTAQAATYPLRARAIGRADFRALEIVRNGVVIARVSSRAEGGHFVAELEQRLDIKETGWVAARVSSGTGDDGGPVFVPPNSPIRPTGPWVNEMGEVVFAHSSPIYFELGGRTLFDPSAAEAMLKKIEADAEIIRAKARFDDERQREDLLRLYRVAIDDLRARLRGETGRIK